MRSIEYSTIARWPRQHHNPHDNVIVRFKKQVWELESKAGTGDDRYVYMEGDRVYILSVRSSHGYVGLAEFILEEKFKESHEQFDDDAYTSISAANEAFIDTDYEIVEVFGRGGLELSAMTILKRMLPYLGDR